jgi:hypothetical protein
MNDEDFDHQIRTILDVQPSAEQLARLERFWMEQSRADYLRRRRWRGAALAAAILAVVAISIWQMRSVPRPVQVTGGTVPDAPIVRHQVFPAHSEPALPIDLQQQEDSFAAGREPTAYERLVFSIRRREPAAARSPANDAALSDLIDDLANKPDVDPQQLIESAKLAADDMERLLLRRLDRSPDDKKRAVLRLLAVCGTSRSKPALLRLARREKFRDAAVTTIDQIVGIERLPEVIGETSHSGVRTALIRRLVMSDSNAGLRGYLALVNDSGTRTAALAAADDISTPPVGALLTCLDDPDEAVRLAAAIVLGHLNGPDITKLLVDRVTQEPEGELEAWIALLACQGELADEFLAYAVRQPQLLAHVNSARVRWARIVH